jgi:poly-gamma-glutamate capsule biosynthesis protein CapA/YwtB (metallophosphatase superfamily)
MREPLQANIPKVQCTHNIFLIAVQLKAFVVSTVALQLQQQYDAVQTMQAGLRTIRAYVSEVRQGTRQADPALLSRIVALITRLQASPPQAVPESHAQVHANSGTVSKVLLRSVCCSNNTHFLDFCRIRPMSQLLLH